MNIKPGYIILGMLCVAVVFSFIGFFTGHSNAHRNFQAEAVKAGHAQFIVVDEYGKTKFEWLPNHSGEKAPADKK